MSLTKELQSKNISPLVSLEINFTLITGNCNMVSNIAKHQDQHIEENAYITSMHEIRKFLMAYVDQSIFLLDEAAMDSYSPCLTLFKEMNYFDKTGLWNFALITDSVSNLCLEQRKALAMIPWSIVMDLDPDSETAGLAQAYELLHNHHVNKFLPEHPQNTVFNKYTEIPYWLFLKGFSGLPTTIVSDSDRYHRAWRQKYGSILTKTFSEYHKAFEKPLKIIILTSEAFIVQQVALELDTVYEDNVFFVALSDSISNMIESLNKIQISMGVDVFAANIIAYQSLFRSQKRDFKCMMPNKEGAFTSVSSEDYNHFELVHQNIAEEDTGENAQRANGRKEFFQGRSCLSWRGAKENYAVFRNEAASRLKRKIRELESTYGVFSLIHDPGVGGTTFVRDLAYKMRVDYPICLLRQYEKKITANQIINLYTTLRGTIIIFVDSSVLTLDQLKMLEKELSPLSFPFVLVYSRRKNISDRTPDLTFFDDNECHEMKKRLNDYASPEVMNKLEEICTMQNQSHDRSPFIMSLYVFEENFAGLRPFIRSFLDGLTREQLNILLYLSIADRYAHRPICEIFFNKPLLSSGLGEDTISGNSGAFEELVVLSREENNRVYRVRHPLFADEIIHQLIYVDEHDNQLIPEVCASNLTNSLIEFIKYSRINQHMVALDTVFEILKNLFILRGKDDSDDSSHINESEKKRFSPLINHIRSLGDSLNAENRIGMIFKTLCAEYPDDPHFLAHLSRFYSYIEKNYSEGVRLAKEAMSMSEADGSCDPFIYHICGQSISTRICEEYWELAKESHENGDYDTELQFIKDIDSSARDALFLFQKARDAMDKSAGFQSAIDLCIDIIEGARSISGEDDTVRFLANNLDAWFIFYIDEAHNLLDAWKNLLDSDAERQYFQLQGKLNQLLGDLNRTVAMWESYLTRAKQIELPLVRRFLARAKQYDLQKRGYEKATPNEIDGILALMEENLLIEPQRSANIRIWFNVVRYCKSKSSEMLLDEALDKLSSWKAATGTIEAYYYFFILTCIKAVDGASRQESVIPALQYELKVKSENRYDNRVIYEWLGKGRGLQRLRQYHVSDIGSAELETLDTRTGYISFKNPGNASIISGQMEVFFNPKHSKQRFTPNDEGKKVEFCMGFSYDGLRAYDQSVKICQLNNDITEKLEKQSVEVTMCSENKTQLTPMPAPSLIVGLRVKCKVNRNVEFYTQLQLLDYRNEQGSVHINDLGENYDQQNQPKVNSILYATIIGPKNKNFWQLSLVAPEEEKLNNTNNSNISRSAWSALDQLG